LIRSLKGRGIYLFQTHIGSSKLNCIMGGPIIPSVLDYIKKEFRI
jgi:hypothetical protein